MSIRKSDEVKNILILSVMSDRLKTQYTLFPRHNPIKKRDNNPTESVLWTGFPSLTENYKLTQRKGAWKIPEVHIQIGKEVERKEGTT